MNSVSIIIIVEGQTEQTFVRDILAPMLGQKKIFVEAAVIGTHGKKGGNINFDRAKASIARFLKQRSNTYVSSMFDYYGMNPIWPGRAASCSIGNAIEKAEIVERETSRAIKKEFPQLNTEKRFIPYISMHEFEALLFSDPEILAREMDVSPSKIHKILKECGEPEEINDNPKTAPSKRLQSLLPTKYRKKSKGKSIAEAITIQTIRKKCPHFNEWVNKLESLAEN